MKAEVTPRDTLVGAIALAMGIAIGFLAERLLRGTRNVEYQTDEDSDDQVLENDEYSRLPNPGSLSENHKLLLCVRTDLKMTRGKIAAQAGHAALGAYKACAKRRPDALAVWQRLAQPKIAVQIQTHQEAIDLQEKAKKIGLSTFAVYDAGRTQVASGSLTVLAIGPGPASAIDTVTGRLKLL